MKYVIAAYVMRYGLATTLTEIAEGLVEVSAVNGIHAQGLTLERKKQLIDAATSVYDIRNKLNLNARAAYPGFKK